MRTGDFSVEVVPHGAGKVRETASGHVLARPGQAYRIRLRNHGPLYAVAQVELDGRAITGGGLVLAPLRTTELERPVDEGEDGRFVVVAEGDETTFGPDGGRDNEALGLIDARFRRELPRRQPRDDGPPTLYSPRERDSSVAVPHRPLPAGFPTPRRIEALRAPGEFFHTFAEPTIERAAGTGLTGHSDQRFVPFELGPLEDEATIIRLRLVIGSASAIDDETRSAPAERLAPTRPLARP